MTQHSAWWQTIDMEERQYPTEDGGRGLVCPDLTPLAEGLWDFPGSGFASQHLLLVSTSSGIPSFRTERGDTVPLGHCVFRAAKCIKKHLYEMLLYEDS